MGEGTPVHQGGDLQCGARWGSWAAGLQRAVAFAEFSHPYSCKMLRLDVQEGEAGDTMCADDPAPLFSAFGGSEEATPGSYEPPDRVGGEGRDAFLTAGFSVPGTRRRPRRSAQRQAVLRRLVTE